MTRSRPWLAIAILGCTLITTPAAAGMGDLFGLGARLPGMAGAGSSLLTGPWASHHNPAGLAFASGDRLSFGFSALDSNLEIAGVKQPIDNQVGLLAGFSMVRQFSGRLDWALGFGLAAFVLPDTLGHVIQHTPETPFFLLYDNRTQRDMFIPAVALRLGDHFSAGLSFDVFAGMMGPISVSEDRPGDVETSLFVDIVTSLRPTPSLMVRPGHGISLSLTYHPEFGVPYDLDVDMDLSGLEMVMQVDGLALFTPHTLVLGFSWSGSKVSLALDLAWAMWSRLGSPFVNVMSRIQEVALLLPSNPSVEMTDSVSVKLGVEAILVATGQMDLLARGGYGYESPVVGPQSGRSNIFDGHKHTIALGLGTAWNTGSTHVPRILVDMYAGAVVVGSLTHDKVISNPADGRDDPTLIVDEDEDTPGDQITNPGYPSISGSGWVFTTAFTLTLELR